MRLPYKSIVVKIGTNALLSKRNTLHKKRLKDIANQLADLHEKGIHIVLVSSGAMGCGRVLIPASSSRSPVEERQLLAAIGQVELMFAYRNAFKRRDIIVAQVLATKDDFRSRKHYLNMMQCFEIMLKENVIPIVNENDVVSVEELMFTDNDELAGLVTSMMEADALIMLTSVDGVMMDTKDGKRKEVIKIIRPDYTTENIEVSGKSSFGRGGMQTKLRIAKKLSSLGTVTHIANALTENILGRILAGEEIGTLILPKKVKRSSTQRWLASATVQQQGSIVVDEGAARAVTGAKPTNLLPVGIRSFSGSFKKGDVISVCNLRGKVIGMGKAAYDSKQLEKNLGKHGQLPFIRCAYFVPLS